MALAPQPTGPLWQLYSRPHKITSAPRLEDRASFTILLSNRLESHTTDSFPPPPFWDGWGEVFLRKTPFTLFPLLLSSPRGGVSNARGQNMSLLPTEKENIKSTKKIKKKTKLKAVWVPLWNPHGDIPVVWRKIQIRDLPN